MTLSAVPGVALSAPSNIELGTTSAVPAPTPTFEGIIWNGPWNPAWLFDFPNGQTYYTTLSTGTLYTVPTATASVIARSDPTWWTFT